MKDNFHIVYSPRAFHGLLESMIKYGESIAPRGEETLEVVNGTIVLRNALDRTVSDRGRNMNIAFGIAEWVAMMFGVDSIDFFKKFISDYDRFSTDGKTLDGAYGTRIIDEHEVNQIDGVIEQLRKDLTTRRAVISIYDSLDLFGRGGKNTPCTLTMQFLYRDEKLHLIVNMRSSDVVRGLTYDAFVFTMIQEYVARQLDVEPGNYYHNAGSLHLYEADRELVTKLTRRRWPWMMQRMPKLSSEDMAVLHDLVCTDMLDSAEFFNHPVVAAKSKTLEQAYVVSLAATCKAFVERRRNADHSEAAYHLISDQTLKYVLRPWLVRAGVLKEHVRTK